MARQTKEGGEGLIKYTETCRPNDELHFIQVSVKGWDTLVQCFAESSGFDDSERLGSFLQRITWQYLPMIEHGLRESLATSL